MSIFYFTTSSLKREEYAMTLSKPPFFPIGKLHMHSMDLKPMTIPCKEEVIFELELTGAHQVKHNVISFFQHFKEFTTS